MFPGVLILEVMAQSCAVLVMHSIGQIGYNKKIYLMSIDNARFRKPVIPGDMVYAHVQITRNHRKIWKCQCQATVDGQRVAEAHITAMIYDS